jgi:hypothetical protein
MSATAPRASRLSAVMREEERVTPLELYLARSRLVPDFAEDSEGADSVAIVSHDYPRTTGHTPAREPSLVRLSRPLPSPLNRCARADSGAAEADSAPLLGSEERACAALLGLTRWDSEGAEGS